MKKTDTKAEQTVPLDSLVGQFFNSKEELYAGLKIAYPEGRRVEFMRSSRQITPSCGVVISHFIAGFPFLNIRPIGGKQRNCYISLTDVITKPNAPDQRRERAKL